MDRPYYLYFGAFGPEREFVKIGITKQGKIGARRIENYCVSRNIPYSNPGKVMHFRLKTTSLMAAKAVEMAVHLTFIVMGRGLWLTGRGTTEVFKVSAKGAYFLTIKALALSGMHDKQPSARKEPKQRLKRAA
jgi:hypothetical protein